MDTVMCFGAHCKSDGRLSLVACRADGCVPIEVRCSHRTFRVAAPETTRIDLVNAYFASIFATPDVVLRHVLPPKKFFAHELNAPFGDCPIVVYYIAIPLSSHIRFIWMTRAQEQHNIALIDFIVNTKDGHIAYPDKISAQDILLNEADFLGLTRPHVIEWNGFVTGETLTDLFRVDAPIDPETTYRTIGVAYAYRPLRTHRAEQFGMMGNVPDTLAASGDVICETRTCVIGIVLVPSRDLAHFSLCKEELPFEKSIVVCYEDVLIRLYGDRYRLSLPGSLAVRVSIDLLAEVHETAIFLAHYTGTPLEEAYSRHQIKITHRLTRRSLEAASFLPPPAYTRSRGVGGSKRDRDTDSDVHESYQGGLILPAAPGIVSGNVHFYDFDSHYPAIILEYGILPKSVDRDATGNEIPDQTILELLDAKRACVDNSNRRRALKLATVVYYGTLGSVFAPHYSERHAALVTKHGRNLLQEMANRFARFDVNIIFGHTDSLVISIDDPDTMNAVSGTIAAFNLEHTHIRLTEEPQLCPFWVINRTSYMGLKLGETNRSTRLAATIETIVRGIEEMSRPSATQCPLTNRGNTNLLLGTVIRDLKQCMVFPGLIVATLPPIMNMMSLLLASTIMMLWDGGLSETLETTQHHLRKCLANLDLDAVKVSDAAIWPWVCEFDLADRTAAAHVKSTNAELSGRIWVALDKYPDTAPLGRRGHDNSVHIGVKTFTNPAGDIGIVDIGASSHAIGKRRVLAQLYRRWNNYLGGFDRAAADTKKVRQLAALLDLIGVETEQIVAKKYASHTPTTPQPRVSETPIHCIPVPSADIPDVRTMMSQLILLNDRTACADRTLECQVHIDRFLDQLREASLTKSITELETVAALSRLLAKLDVDEAIRMSVPSCALLQKYYDESCVTPWRDLYRTVLISVASFSV